MTTISHDTYEILLNLIGFWLVDNNRTFQKRNNYEYQGRTADLGTIEKVLKERGKTPTTDGLTGRYTEASIVDNTNYDFLPNYVTYQNTLYQKANVINMVQRVLTYENQHGTIPRTVDTEIKPVPSPTPTPTGLKPYITTKGGGKLGQTNGYRCGPHSLMQCIYRLTGIELSESELAGVCGTTTSGTSHQGLETGIAYINRKYGTNIKINWCNLSDIGWDGLQKAINDGAVFIHLLYRNKYGHYEVPQKIGNTLTILNSLGEYCGYPAYCGYIENRSRATQQYYIQGISQKSIAILTK